jgi:putative ABC transport system ATP-binding protein
MDYADMYDFDQRPARALELLKLVGLEKFANKLPVLVSTGQQQLVAIARALACDSPLLVADEPTGNLDSKSAGAIIDLFTELSHDGKTIVMVTHDPSLTARTTRNIIISDGELIDESVSQALPLLRHRHMLEITRKAGRVTFQPGEVILDMGQHVENLYIIARGSVDILSYRGVRSKLLSHLGAGEFFGEIELLRGGKSIASVRAGAHPVEVLTFPRVDFLRIVEESPITAEALGKIVQHRLEQHRAINGRTKNKPGHRV